MQKLKLLALGAMLLGASSVNAGQLLSATYTQTLQGVPLALGTPTGGTPTGTLTGNTFTLNAGNAFAISFCVANPGVAGCIANPTGPFTPPVTRLVVSFTNNGPLTGTLADPTITAPSGIMGDVLVKARIKGSPSFTLLAIPVNAGAGGNVTTPPTTSPYFTSATLKVYFGGDVWHLGTVTQTGLTDDSVAISDATGMGGVAVTPGGNTIVTLVSLGRVKVRSALGANSDTASTSYLKLTFAPSVPEPGTLMLLGAGVAGLVLVGRRKLQ
jgi:hypothetical protein